MANEDGSKTSQAVTWGVFMIAVGALFLLVQFDIVDLPSIGRLWPLVYLVFVTSSLLERRWGAALSWLLLGTIFLAITLNWYGLTYQNGWPLFLIAGGGGMVMRALSGEGSKPPKSEATVVQEERHES